MLKRMVLMMALATWIAAPLVNAETAHDAAHATAAKAEKAVHAHADHAAGDAHGAADAHGADAHGGHEKPPLIPDPTNPETWYSALWVVIIFVVLLVILYPTAWKNVLAGLKAREERIRKDIADAEAARVKAENALTKYTQQLATAEQQVRDLIAKASADAERIAAGIRTHAQAEAEDIKERATRDIDNARKSAVDEIHNYAADLATSIAEKILRRSLNANDQKDLVARSLEQMQTLSK